MEKAPLRVRIDKRGQKRREATGLSQESFAPLADFHRTYISTIERGKKDVTIETLARVRAALKVPLWRIFKDAED